MPEGFSTVTPYLLIPGADEAVEFYKRAFNAEEILRMDADDGRIVHTEIRVGDSPVMIGDPTLVGSREEDQRRTSLPSVQLFLYVEDVDAVVQQALAAGATRFAAVQDHELEGDRRGAVRDPFGNVWWIATHVKPISRDEIGRRHRLSGA
jgi:PhnB protein